MNVKYSINPETCLMQLKLREDVLEGLLPVQQTIFYEDILPILNSDPKYAMAGSLALRLLGFEKMEPVGDFDIAILSAFTQENYSRLLCDYNLIPVPCIDGNFSVGYTSNARSWRFTKTTALPEGFYSYMLDVFNNIINPNRDVIEVYLGDSLIRIQHPSINWSFRMQYALDSRSGMAQKYWRRFRDMFFNQERIQHFFDLQRTIHRMAIAVEAHNTSIDRTPALIEQVRELLINGTDYDKIFNSTLERDVLDTINPETSKYPRTWDLGF